MKVLFVCKSNVARSQMAEALFESMTSKHKAFSAGVAVESIYLDKPLMQTTEHVVPVMREEGIDVSLKVSKQLTPEMVSRADKIVVMVPKEHCPEYLSSNPRCVFWHVRDPRHGGAREQKEIRDEIKVKIKELLEEIN